MWGVTFAGATANDIPFAIDTDGINGQELAVYRNGRITIRRDNGTYWGFNYQGAGIDEVPLGIDTNGDGRQEFTMYSHKTRQLAAKQILANDRIDKSGRLVIDDLQRTADGGAGTAGANVSSTLLELIDLVSQSHSVSVTALESGGSGHSANSAHYIGEAVDFGALDNVLISGRNAPAITLINMVKASMPAGPHMTGDRLTTGFGQSPCGTTPALPPGIASFPDTCDHLHVQLTQGTP